MQHQHLIKQITNSKSAHERLDNFLFRIFTKLGMFFILFTLNFTVFAQTQSEINAVRNAIANAKLLDQSISIGGSGAGYEWYVVKRENNANGEKCALLISKHRIIHYGIAFNSAGTNKYEGSSLQTQVTNTEYGHLPAILKMIAVQPKDLGKYDDIKAISTPSTTMAKDISNKKDILFPPSYEEVRIWNNGVTTPLRKEIHDYQAFRWWTRTASTCSGTSPYVWEILVSSNNFVCTAHAMGSTNGGVEGVGFVGAIWVRYSLDLFSVSGTVTGLQNNMGVQVCYKIDNGAPQCVFTTAGGAYKISNIPSGSNVEIIPSTQQDYNAMLLFAPNPMNVTANLIEKNINYCPIAIAITGASEVTLGEDITLSTTGASGGKWRSLNPTIASVDPATGVVTGISAGVATIEYTVTNNGCTNSTSVQVTVVEFVNETFTLYGTVFPFVYTGKEDFDTLCKVKARLYDASLIEKEKNRAIAFRRNKPLKETEAVYYDGKIFVKTTPLHPGEIGSINNPGIPIKWEKLGYAPTRTDTATVLRDDNNPDKSVGLYTFENVEEGEYILTLSSRGFVTRYAKIKIDSDTSLGHRELISGDFDNNGQIDQRDITIGNAMKSRDFSQRYQTMYDVNKDGNVNTDDIQFITGVYYGFIYLLYQDTWDWLMIEK